jgi:hypothetical protein
MKVTRVFDDATVKDSEVEIAGRGKGVLKGVSYPAGSELNYFVEEIIKERGLPTYRLLQIFHAGDFHDGWALVSVGNDRFVYVNAKGETLGGEVFYEAFDFSEGMALVRPGKDDFPVYINSKGESLFMLRVFVGGRPVARNSVTSRRPALSRMAFHEGLVCAVTSENNTAVILDKSGKNVVGIKDKTGKVISKASDWGYFSEGLSWIAGRRERYEKYITVFNANGDCVFEFLADGNWKNSRSFSDGLLIAEISPYVTNPERVMVRTKVALDKSGKIAIDLKDIYGSHDAFSEGMLGIREKGAGMGGKWAFIDKSGRQVTNFNFSSVEPFSEGLALVEQGKWGFIDKRGEIAIPIKYGKAWSFSEGLAPVFTDSSFTSYEKRECLYIDKKGNTAFKPAIDELGSKSNFYAYSKGIRVMEAAPFSEGLSRIVCAGSSGESPLTAYIDKKGSVKLWFAGQRQRY